MFDFFKSFFNHLSREERVIVGVSGLWGWILNLHLLDLRTFTWDFFVKGLAGLAMSSAGIFTGLVIKDLYKYAKPKAMKYMKGRLEKRKNKRA